MMIFHTNYWQIWSAQKLPYVHKLSHIGFVYLLTSALNRTTQKAFCMQLVASTFWLSLCFPTHLMTLKNGTTNTGYAHMARWILSLGCLWSKKMVLWHAVCYCIQIKQLITRVSMKMPSSNLKPNNGMGMFLSCGLINNGHDNGHWIPTFFNLFFIHTKLGGAALGGHLFC